MAVVMESDDRAIVYEEASRRIYRASGLGGCIRSLVAAGMGISPAEPHDFMKRAAEFGQEAEPNLIHHLENDGWKLVSQQEVVELRVGRAVIRGHIDAIVEKDGQRRIVECKTSSQDRADRIIRCVREGRFHEVEPKYAFQISVYMLRLKLPALYVVWPTKTNDEGTRELVGSPTVLEIHKPPVGIVDIVSRIQKAEEWIEKAEFPKCDRSESRYFCPFRHLCENEEPQPEEAPEINAWARMYADAKEQRDRAEKVMEEAKTRMIEAIGESGRIDTEEYRVIVTKSSRTYYDTRSIRQNDALAELLKPFERTSHFIQLRVTPKGDS